MDLVNKIQLELLDEYKRNLKGLQKELDNKQDFMIRGYMVMKSG